MPLRAGGAPVDLDAVWARYRADGAVGDRNTLIEHYLPIVDRVAAKVGPGLPRHVSHEDLVSHGTIGLIDAVSKFDPERGVTFAAFAWPRIKGEMIDMLRRTDTVQRSLRAMARRIETGRAAMTTSLGRFPTSEELAGELSVTVAQLHEMMSDLALTEAPLSLDSGTDSPLAPPLRELVPDEQDDLADGYEIDELRLSVAAAFNALPERERAVVRLRYVEGLTLTEAGEALGVATSRVSQLTTNAVRMIRERLAVL